MRPVAVSYVRTIDRCVCVERERVWRRCARCRAVIGRSLSFDAKAKGRKSLFRWTSAAIQSARANFVLSIAHGTRFVNNGHSIAAIDAKVVWRARNVPFSFSFLFFPLRYFHFFFFFSSRCYIAKYFFFFFFYNFTRRNSIVVRMYRYGSTKRCRNVTKLCSVVWMEKFARSFRGNEIFPETIRS